MKQKEGTLPSVLEGTFAALDKAIDEFEPDLRPREVGQVVYAGKGVARVAGLPSVRSEEILTFPGGLRGLAFNVDPDEVGAGLSLAIGAVLFAILTDSPWLVFGWSSAQYLLYGFAFAVVASLLSGLYPAWKAANDPPVEALRG